MFQKFSKQLLSLADAGDFPKIVRVINAVQAAVENINNPISNKPQLDSLVLKSIQLKQGLNIINHTLGRVFSGYKITRTSNQVDIWDDATNNSPNLVIWLYASANATVDLEVY